MSKRKLRKNREKRVRGKIRGTSNRPRLSVFRSLKYVYAQLIDDNAGKTLAAEKGERMEAKKVGQMIAEKAIKAGLKKVVFDRGGYRYHGCVKNLAEGAREGGLEF